MFTYWLSYCTEYGLNHKDSKEQEELLLAEFADNAERMPPKENGKNPKNIFIKKIY